jgi:hypothetical protein
MAGDTGCLPWEGKFLCQIALGRFSRSVAARVNFTVELILAAM